MPVILGKITHRIKTRIHNEVSPHHMNGVIHASLSKNELPKTHRFIFLCSLCVATLSLLVSPLTYAQNARTAGYRNSRCDRTSLTNRGA